MRKEIVLRQRYRELHGPGNMAFCLQGVDKVIVMPYGASKIILVAADKRMCKNSFRIKRPVSRLVFEKHPSYRLSNLADIGGEYISIWTREEIAKLYDAGYRYVRLEYEN